MAQDYIGQPVVEVVVEEEGSASRIRWSSICCRHASASRSRWPTSGPPTITSITCGASMTSRPNAEPAAGGVRVRYTLVPSHPIDRIEFSGDVALSQSDLRRVVTDRFGRSPNPSRAAEAATTLQNEYRRRGYPAASVAARVEATHNPHRATLTFDVNAGRRARIADLQFRRLDPDEANAVFPLPEIRVGEPVRPGQSSGGAGPLGRTDALAGLLPGAREQRAEHSG